MSKKLRIIFAGTTQFAVSHLNTLLSFRYNIVGVLTQPNRPAGRGIKLMPSPVKVLAERRGLPVFQPISLFTQESQQWIKKLNADVIVVVAYGLILPQAVLTMPRLCCINVHGSLLPRWRGAAPIQHAILAGDRKTGITIIHMDTGLDTGNILCRLECSISTNDTSASLFEKLADLGSQGLIKTLQKLAEGTMTSEIQCERLVTYAKKLSRKEAKINWSLSAIQLERCIRAFNPWPISWFIIKGQPIKIWKASVIQAQINTKPGTVLKTSKNGIQIATIDNILNLEALQPAGKRVMSVRELLNSRYEWFMPGTCLA